MGYISVLKYVAPVVLVLLAIYAAYDHGIDTERERWENRAYQAVISSHEAASKFTAGLLTSNKETEENAQDKIDSHQGDIAVAATAAGLLREELEAYIQRSAADSARFANDRKAAETRYRVLADMYAESDRLAGVYADQADKNRIAGETCERSYDSLIEWIRKTYGIR